MRARSTRSLPVAARWVAAFRVAALVFLAAPCFGITTVTGLVVDGLGAPATATLDISWPSFVNPSAELVAAGSKRVLMVNGALSVDLEPNTGSTPAGTFYTVRLFGRELNAVEYWVVPDSGTPVDVTTIRVAIPPTPAAIINVAQLPNIELMPSGLTALRCVQTGADGKLTVAAGPCSSAAGGLDCASPTELTIASGAITVASTACYLVDTESDAASDDLTAIACAAGTRFILRAASSARTVRLVDDNTALDLMASFLLDHPGDAFAGLCTGTNTVVEVSRSNAQ